MEADKFMLTVSDLVQYHYCPRKVYFLKVMGVPTVQRKTIIPIEIKYSDFVAAYRGRKKQLTAYAMLLESKYGKKVRKGILYFPEQNEQIEVEISEEDKKYVLRDLEKIRAMIKSERMPGKVEESKCKYCEVAKYCV